MTDKHMSGLREKFARRPNLHHGTIQHHHHCIGKRERLGLIMRDIDHGHIKLLVKLFQLGA